MAAVALRPNADLAAVIAEVNLLIAAAAASNPVSGAVPLRIVRGRVGSGGAIISGEGFTSALGATGVYTVTFTTAFSVAPAVDVSASAGGSIHQVTPSTGSFVATSIDSALQTATNSGFSFIAIGAA